ncbi:carboxylate-amine ligase [Rhodovulum sulfidophilum]|uniref:carboxylate-amine ligase n=1 Tax=Rhodovulum sulfidophilum TaxID=35806 RepID=UPI001925B4F3|nr:carboxylate-amine ligase [Rhodovulum sulfidophilum]MBL3584515.1 carboxylate-amine ligase [Rhodovulum sulfidophilum]
MSASEPDFTLGIEEEYLLVDRETCALAQAPKDLMAACAADLGDQVTPEFLQCQIEVGTRVCRSVAEAREELRRLRATVAHHAAQFGLAPIAASCHPSADWLDQNHTDKDRYNDLDRALAAVARRMLICGMHVHVGIPDPDQRIDLMTQFSYFLPHLLAMSTSSPFWKGVDTGLASYRLTVFDNLPRTGLPPRFESWSEYDRSVGTLIRLGLIEDATKIWWDLRPSARFPTLETRICDMSPRLDHTLSLAALIQCTLRMLWRLAGENLRWRIYERFLVGENRWRAQRYGVSEGLVDFGRKELVPFADLLEELIQLVEADAAVLGCLDEIHAARDVIAHGTSAERQRKAHAAALATGADSAEAMRAVVRLLIEEFGADL